MSLSFGRRFNPPRRARHSFAVSLTVALVLIAAMLGSCTDQAEQRAIEPGQVIFAPSTTAGVAPGMSASSAFGTPDASPADLTGALPSSLSGEAVPASSRAYFTNGGDLWQIPFASGDAAPVVTGKSILAFASSADGEQVAIVYLAPDSGKEHLAEFKADGNSVVDVELQIPADDQTSRGGDIQSIAWSPRGDKLAIARQDGSIAVVALDGTVKQLVNPNPDGFPGSLSVSPDGRTLLFLDPDLPGRDTSLFAVPMSGGGTRKLVDGTEMSRPVLEARWLPGSDLIAYVQAVTTSPPGTGDVFSIGAASTTSKLLVSSSQFAPVAGIGNLAFSNDGKWVAFTVYGPHEDGSRFQGLWLMNLATGSTHQVTIDPGQAVTDLWFGKESLAYRSVETAETKSPEHYTGLEPFWLYSGSLDGSGEVLRYKSSR